MRPLLRLIDAMTAFGAGVAAIACGVLAAMLVFEVVVTSFFGWSQPWAVEYSGYLLAATLFAGSGWALGRGGHIRVLVAVQGLPPGARRAADLAATVFALGIAGFVAVAAAENAARSFSLGSVSYYPSRTPLWAPQAVLAAGWALLTLGLFARAARLLTGEAPEEPDAGGHA